MQWSINILSVLLTVSIRTAAFTATQPLLDVHRIRDIEPRDNKCYNSVPGHTCGKKGIIKKPRGAYGPYGGQEYTVPSPDYCRYVALSTSGATSGASLRYNADNATCLVFLNSLKRMDFEESTTTGSNNTYWDVECFECLNKCPSVVGLNLLLNGGFERFNDSILPWFAYGKVVSPGFRSPQAMDYTSAEKYGYGTFYNVFYSGTAVCDPPLVYLLQFRYQYIFPTGQPPGPYSNYQIEPSVGDLEYLINPPHQYNATWLFSGGLFRAGGGNGYSTLGIYADTPVQGTRVLFDDIFITYINPAVIPGAPNLIRNPSFEDGMLSPWTSGCQVVSDTSYNSTYSVLCNVNGNPGWFTSYSLLQNVTTEILSPYLLSFDYKVIPGDDPFVPTLTVGLNDIESNADNGIVHNEWAHYEHYFVGDTRKSVLAIQPGGHAQMYFDNFELRKISLNG